MVDDPFSGWGLRPVELADRFLLESYFASLAQPLSDYTFPQLFTWRNSLRIFWCELEGHLCVFANGTGDLTLLMPPIGDTRSDRALVAAVEIMDAYNASHGVPDRTRVEYASEELLARFDRARLSVEPMGFDYLYDVNRMIDLAGGALASKRQAKSRFLRLYDHRVEPYTAALHREPCRQLLLDWQQRQSADTSPQPLTADRAKRTKEITATDLCLDSADGLGIQGMVVYARDREIASGDLTLQGFTFGELLGRDQSSITIEKTDLTTRGLAQFIFSEFCRRCWATRPLVNVGDDWGLPTLAWTKMSYRPAKLLQKYMLRRLPVAMAAVKPARDFAFEPLLPMRGTQPLPIRVRAAGKEDLAAALELEQSCFSAEVSLKKRQLQYLQKRSSAIFLVAEQGDQIVGEGIALVRQHRAGLSGRIYSLAVHGKSRGRSVGRSLLQAMCTALHARGVRRIHLEVERGNEHAARLYARQGFRSIGALPNYYGPGRDGIQMMFAIDAKTASSVT